MTGSLPINLHDPLRQRTIEGERVEYKRGWNPQSVLHTICAFANDSHNLGGGYVVLGVEEPDGQPLLPPKGIDAGRIEAVQNELLRLGQSAIQPHYHPLTSSTTSKVGSSSCYGLMAGKNAPAMPESILHEEGRGGRTTFARTAARSAPEAPTNAS